MFLQHPPSAVTLACTGLASSSSSSIKCSSGQTEIGRYLLRVRQRLLVGAEQHELARVGHRERRVRALAALRYLVPAQHAKQLKPPSPPCCWPPAPCQRVSGASTFTEPPLPPCCWPRHTGVAVSGACRGTGLVAEEGCRGSPSPDCGGQLFHEVAVGRVWQVRPRVQHLRRSIPPHVTVARHALFLQAACVVVGGCALCRGARAHLVVRALHEPLLQLHHVRDAFAVQRLIRHTATHRRHIINLRQCAPYPCEWPAECIRLCSNWHGGCWRDCGKRPLTSGESSSSSVWNSAMRFCTSSRSRSRPMMMLASPEGGSSALYAHARAPCQHGPAAGSMQERKSDVTAGIPSLGVCVVGLQLQVVALEGCLVLQPHAQEHRLLQDVAYRACSRPLVSCPS